VSVFGENYDCPMMQGSDGRIPKGVYLWGTVGGGKTMLMDMFYDTLEGKLFCFCILLLCPYHFLDCIPSNSLSSFLELINFVASD
jgi:predicted ATPase